MKKCPQCGTRYETFSEWILRNSNETGHPIIEYMLLSSIPPINILFWIIGFICYCSDKKTILFEK